MSGVTNGSMIRAAFGDLVASAAVTRTVRCYLCGADETLTLQYSEAERQVLLNGRPDPLDRWFCDTCHAARRTDESRR